MSGLLDHTVTTPNILVPKGRWYTRRYVSHVIAVRTGRSIRVAGSILSITEHVLVLLLQNLTHGFSHGSFSLRVGFQSLPTNKPQVTENFWRNLRMCNSLMR